MASAGKIGRCALVAALILFCLAVTVPVNTWLQAALLLLDAADLQGRAGRLARWTGQQVRTQEVLVPTRYGTIRGRFYIPADPSPGAVLLVHGLHVAGIAEERLGPFARKLAARKVVVLTPQMEELRRYRITSETTDNIEDSVRWLTGQPEFVRGGKVGLVGISFSGGLSIVAAGRPAIRDRVSFVLSVGGHGEMYRATRFLCTGQLPEGRGYFKPHDYGVGILLLNLSPRFVPPAQAAPLAEGIAAYLQEDYQRGRSMIQTLPHPASEILSWVDTRDASRIGPMMLSELEEFASDPNLSPERSAPPSAPVFLLHGQGDRLIPAFETEALAKHLRGKTKVYWLITPLISHVELERAPGARDIWNLVRFWERIFRAADA